MRWTLITLLLVGLIGCGETDAENRAKMASQAAAARAAEEPVLDPMGVWAVDLDGLARLQAGEVFFETKNKHVDFKDSLTADASGTVTVTPDKKFHLQMTAAGQSIELKGYMGIDEPNLELFASERDGQPLAKNMMILGEVSGDKMMLHLFPMRVWVPMSRQ